MQQKQLSSHTKIGATGGGGRGGGVRIGGNNSIDIVLFYDVNQSLFGSNNLRDMNLFYDFINARFHHVSPSHD